MNNAKYYWAVVGDASPEPVAVVIENGKRVAYTCGCPDPFELDVPEPLIELIPAITNDSARPELYDKPAGPMQIAVTKKKASEARLHREKQMEADRSRGVYHSHRRFNP